MVLRLFTFSLVLSFLPLAKLTFSLSCFFSGDDSGSRLGQRARWESVGAGNRTMQDPVLSGLLKTAKNDSHITNSFRKVLFNRTVNLKKSIRDYGFKPKVIAPLKRTFEGSWLSLRWTTSVSWWPSILRRSCFRRNDVASSSSGLPSDQDRILKKKKNKTLIYFRSQLEMLFLFPADAFDGVRSRDSNLNPEERP